MFGCLFAFFCAHELAALVRRLVKGAAARFGSAVGVGAAEAAAAAKLAPEARSALLATLEAGGSACAQCGDLPEDPLVAVCSHLFCRQCIAVQARRTAPCPLTLRTALETLPMSCGDLLRGWWLPARTCSAASASWCRFHASEHAHGL